MREKDRKTHQKRRVALDESAVGVVRDHLMRQDWDAAELGFALDGRAFRFSLDRDCERPLVPDSRRYLEEGRGPLPSISCLLIVCESAED